MTDAVVVDTMHGLEDGVPVFIEKWQLEPEDFKVLAGDGYIQLKFYVPQLVVHSMTVVDP